jgi:hypothetical protein
VLEARFGLDEALPTFDPIELEEVAEVGDRLVVGLRFRSPNGAPSEVPVRLYQVLTFRDGRILRMDDFATRKRAMRHAGRGR